MEINQLKQQQLKLAKKVSLKNEVDEIILIGAFDQQYLDDQILSVIGIFDFKTKKLVEFKYSLQKTPLSYIPGYLAFRETPSMVDAYSRLENQPEVILVNAHGILHPRKIGLASHLGLLLDKPVIGLGKKLIVGEQAEDSKIHLFGKVCGQAVKMKEHSRPVYVSPGHKVSLKKAVEVVKKCKQEPYKLPWPLAYIHKIAVRLKKKIKEGEKEEEGEKEKGSEEPEEEKKKEKRGRRKGKRKEEKNP